MIKKIIALPAALQHTYQATQTCYTEFLWKRNKKIRNLADLFFKNCLPKCTDLVAGNARRAMRYVRGQEIFNGLCGANCVALSATDEASM